MAQTTSTLPLSLDKLDASSFSDNSERIEAKNAALRLVSRLETPWETTIDHVWSRPALSASLKLGIDIELFKKWTANGGGRKTAGELAIMTGIDPTLLERPLRHMGAMLALTEVAEETYEMTPFTKSLAEIGHSSCFSHWVDVNAACFAALPAFLAETNYANPHDPSHSNWRKANNSGLDFFPWLAANPKAGLDFQNVMTAYSASKPALGEVYPTENIITGWNRQAPLLIDMGGSRGHDIEKFRAQHPDLPNGSLVLQDLAGPIGEAQVSGPVIKQVHDFFEPQPVRGARAYYMHIVLHDWPDSEAIKILKNIATAMVRGYSKVLVQESVMGGRHPSPQSTSSDLTMLAVLSAAERTGQSWKDLFHSAGLKVVKIWSTPASVESVIEAELA